MHKFNIRHFTSKDSKPLVNLVALDSESLDFAFRNSVENDWNATNLAQPNPFVREKLETRLRKGNAIHSTFETRKSFLFARLIFDSAKEVSKSFVNSIGNILLRLRMNFRIFTSKIFVEVKTTKRYFSKLVAVNRQSKKLIVNCFVILERFNDSYILLIRRIQTIFIHQLNDHRGIDYD